MCLLSAGRPRDSRSKGSMNWAMLLTSQLIEPQPPRHPRLVSSLAHIVEILALLKLEPSARLPDVTSFLAEGLLFRCCQPWQAPHLTLPEMLLAEKRRHRQRWSGIGLTPFDLLGLPLVSRPAASLSLTVQSARRRSDAKMASIRVALSDSPRALACYV